MGPGLGSRQESWSSIFRNKLASLRVATYSQGHCQLPGRKVRSSFSRSKLASLRVPTYSQGQAELPDQKAGSLIPGMSWRPQRGQLSPRDRANFQAGKLKLYASCAVPYRTVSSKNKLASLREPTYSEDQTEFPRKKSGSLNSRNKLAPLRVPTYSQGKCQLPGRKVRSSVVSRISWRP